MRGAAGRRLRAHLREVRQRHLNDVDVGIELLAEPLGDEHAEAGSGPGIPGWRGLRERSVAWSVGLDQLADSIQASRSAAWNGRFGRGM